MKNNIKIDDSSKKILIIGANGFLGNQLLQIGKNYKESTTDFEIIAADILNNYILPEIPFYFLDITKPQEVTKKILEISPEVIILTSAITNVDQNEIEKELASRINTEGPKHVLKACKKVNAKLVFMSTDFVFDGISKSGNYNENDEPNPLNHYGKTKYEAEKAILHSELDFLICRIAVLYGWNKDKLNFITWILNKLEQQEKISIVTNQINNATFAPNLAEIILTLIEKNAHGIYHTAGDGALSRYEMAIKCAEVFNCDKNLITPIDYLKQKAIRPKNAGLDISKLKKLIQSELKIFKLIDGLKYMKKNRDE